MENYSSFKKFIESVKHTRKQKLYNLSYIMVADFFEYAVLKNVFVSIHNIEDNLGNAIPPFSTLSKFRKTMVKEMLQRIENEYGLQFAQNIAGLLEF